MVEESDKKEGSKLNTPTLVLLGVIVLQVGVVAATAYWLKGSLEGSGGNDFRFPVWFIPILIPLLASRKNNFTTKQKRTMTWVMVGLGSLVLVGMVVFLLKAAS